MRFGLSFGPAIAMPSYRLSAEAAADIAAIGDYGIATFGLAQALKYHLGLESRFELLGHFRASVRLPMIYGPAYIATITYPTPFSTPSSPITCSSSVFSMPARTSSVISDALSWEDIAVR